MWYRIGGLVFLVVGAIVVAGVVIFRPFSQRDSALRLPGIVEIQEVRLGPRVAGRVAEVLVNEGDAVTADQILVRLDASEMAAQRDALRARVRIAEADYEQVNNGPRALEREAATMAARAAKARLERLQHGFREEEKRQAASDLDAARADERMAIEEFARVSKLRRQRAASDTDFDTWQSNLERARGKVAAAKAKHDLMVRGARSEDVDEARAEWQRLDAQRKLLQEGSRPEEIAQASGRLAEARAKLDEADIRVRETIVRSAEPGIVEVVSVRKGDLVSANQSVVRVLRRADLWVKTYVPETQLGKLHLGQSVRVRMDAYADTWLDGKITQIGSESEFTPRNIQTVDERRHQMFGVRIRIEDPRGLFKSGMAAEVVIPVEKE